MQIPKIKTYMNIGLVWYEVQIEADQASALPGIEIIWLPDTAIRESKERIRAVFKRIWIVMPPRKIILNLSPSDLKKTGTRFDLALATALFILLCPCEQSIRTICATSIFIGELWLDGEIRPVSWVLPSVLSACREGYAHFFVPYGNVEEIKYVPDISIYAYKNFEAFVQMLRWEAPLVSIYDQIRTGGVAQNAVIVSMPHENSQTQITFSDIQGHEKTKRALVIAAAGAHNCILKGPPWTWKTLLAQWVASILPWLSFEQTLEVSQIYSVAGKLSSNCPMITRRPFRQVHHTITKVAIVWWWQSLLPWEVSLAHHWVLFLDELPEFHRETLEALRQPLEDGYIMISRAQWSVRYPTQCLVIAAMNACPCWYYGDPEHACVCSTHEVKKYQARVSWPRRERCDLLLSVARQEVDVLLWPPPIERYQQYASSVQQAYEIQQRRYKGENIYANAYLSVRNLWTYVKCDEKSERLLKEASKRLHLSARITHKLLRVARTIADLEQATIINAHHMAEALQYRPKQFFIDT